MKKYLKDVKQGIVPTTYWADDDYEEPLDIGTTSWDHEHSGHSQIGINELTSIVGPGHGFETVKPMKLIKKIIQIWCPPTGIVLDPFAGSGTSLVAAKAAGVPSVGIEKSERYCEIAARRLAQDVLDFGEAS